ncbi:hypothetical protein HAX54_010320, partial [Datura stramonium]|nr:hypothetical protein [Datura stramonium]
ATQCTGSLMHGDVRRAGSPPQRAAAGRTLQHAARRSTVLPQWEVYRRPPPLPHIYVCDVCECDMFDESFKYFPKIVGGLGRCSLLDFQQSRSDKLSNHLQSWNSS